MKSFKLILFIFTLFCFVIPLFCIFQNNLKQLYNMGNFEKIFLNDDNIELNHTKYTWNEEWYEEMPIDHYSYGNPMTFRLRLFYIFLIF